MVEVRIDYEGELHCIALHGPSGSVIETDAPVDNQGRGAAFSPTDLVATALGSCMATIMGIVGRQGGIDLKGMTIRVQKEMSCDLPRRISKLAVEIVMPIAEAHPSAELLKASALDCPVNQSIASEIDVSVVWIWE